MREQPFRQIARELSARIRRGEYAPGAALPSRLELMREFDVARATLDRAIRELVHQELLISRHGSGTFVAPGGGAAKWHVALVGATIPLEYEKLPFKITLVSSGEVERKSQWRRLFEFDGILWLRPETPLFPVIEALAGRVPQVVVNRVYPGIAYVSTDHRGAYYRIVRDRLAAHPDAIPVLLASDPGTIPTGYRRDGFVDACREAGTFYEIWPLPRGFAGKLARLREHAGKLPAARPWIWVADALAHTGAVMRLGAELGFRWGEQVFYSDFDDEYDESVWGIRVTSFLQDQPGLITEAAELLTRQMESGEMIGDGRLVAPEFRCGES